MHVYIRLNNASLIRPISLFYVCLLNEIFLLFLGNMIKASSILHKALALNAQPSQLLNIAIRNLKAGEKRLLDPDEELLMGRDSF